MATGRHGTLAIGRHGTLTDRLEISVIGHRAVTLAIDRLEILVTGRRGISAIGRHATGTTSASSAPGEARAIGRPSAKARPNVAAASAAAVAAASVRVDHHPADASSLEAAPRRRGARQHRRRR
jgi:hypothetical protein